mgnify:CR=1 FL=1
MKKITAFLLLFFLSFFIFRGALSVFFVQDDFILINQFFKGNLIADIIRTFAYPEVTHWRPVHNLYFMLLGNVFEKNYYMYHIVAFIIHFACSFLIFKIVSKIIKSEVLAYFTSLLYIVHPVHLVSLFWISGNATSIAFLFFLLSFYYFLSKKRNFSLIFYLISILASEAMIFTFPIFLIRTYLFDNIKSEKKYFIKLFCITVIFTITKWFLTPKETFNTYRLEFFKGVFTSIKYYILRVLGFGESSGDFNLSIALIIFYIILFFSFFKTKTTWEKIKKYLMSVVIIISGLFPFILIPNHLSPHYMNISVWGFAFFIVLTLENLKLKNQIIFVGFFVLVSIITVNNLVKNSWVIDRSRIAQEYINQIEKVNVEQGSTIIFNDNDISTSYEAYISLGTGEALNFYFPDKNYKMCFTEFENCQALP